MNPKIDTPADLRADLDRRLAELKMPVALYGQIILTKRYLDACTYDPAARDRSKRLSQELRKYVGEGYFKRADALVARARQDPSLQKEINRLWAWE